MVQLKDLIEFTALKPTFDIIANKIPFITNFDKLLRFSECAYQL